MNINIRVGLSDKDTLSALNGLHVRINNLFTNLFQRINQMADQITELQAAVAQSITVEQSAITLINGITQRVTDAVTAALAANPGVDLTPLTDLTSQINAETVALAAAVTANTPAAPAPTTP